MKHWDKAPFFIVNNFVEGDTDCADYLPGDPNDIDIGDAHEVVLDACKVRRREGTSCKCRGDLNVCIDGDFKFMNHDF